MKAILATDDGMVLAVDGKLPLAGTPAGKEDMAYFKRMTKGCSLVMGMKTWETLGKKPLKDRGIHFIITRQNIKNDPYSPVRYMDMNTFLNILPSIDSDNLWCIGGKSVYEQLFSYCDEIHWNDWTPEDCTATKSGELTTIKPLDESLWEKTTETTDIQGFTKNVYKKKK